MKFNSEVPTESIQSKMKEHTKRMAELFSNDRIVVNIHLRMQLSNLREYLQRNDGVTQLDSRVDVSIFTDQ